MLKAPARLIGLAARHLASSLSKGGALHPMAQRMRIDLADEKKVFEAAVHYLFCFMTIGAGGVGLVYEHKYSLDRQKQTRLEIEQILQKHMQGISQRVEKAHQGIDQIRHEYQEMNQIRHGFPIINHVRDDDGGLVKAINLEKYDWGQLRLDYINPWLTKVAKERGGDG